MTLNDFSRELQELGNRMDKGLSQEQTTMALHQLLVDLVNHLITVEVRAEVQRQRDLVASAHRRSEASETEGRRAHMTEFDFTNHRPMVHHAPSELLLHLQEHLSWARLHLDEYRNRCPNPFMHTTLTEIHYHIQQAMHWLDTLPHKTQEDSHD